MNEIKNSSQVFLENCFANDEQEVRSLYKLISQKKKIESTQQEKQIFHLLSYMNQLIHQPLSEKMERPFFTLLFELMTVNGYLPGDEPRPKGRGMIWEEFETPPKFGYEGNDPFELMGKIVYKAFRQQRSVEIHQEGLKTFQKIFSEGTDVRLRAALLKTFPHLINHPKLPAETQLASLPWLMPQGEEIDPPLIEALQTLLHRRKVDNLVKDRAAATLFCLLPGDNSKQREMIIDSFPLSREAVPSHLKDSAIEKFTYILLSEEEPLLCRHAALQKLIEWVHSCEKKETLTFVLRAFQQLFLKGLSELRQQLLGPEGLFQIIWLSSDTIQIVRTLSLLYIQLLNDEKIPDTLKIELIDAMPYAQADETNPPRGNAISLFRFMIQQLKKETVSLELKKKYCKQIQTFHQFETTRLLLALNSLEEGTLELTQKYLPLRKISWPKET
ncbi:MAG: hypothetical protein KGJ02_02545 [Verrucomicrobiota bacterium]|nr:hypothetical protein [Verrucomicrobiota bacterium]